MEKRIASHQGRLPYAYHDFVLKNLEKIDTIAKGDKVVFLKLFEGLKQKIKNNPDMLYKDYWRKKLK